MNATGADFRRIRENFHKQSTTTANINETKRKLIFTIVDPEKWITVKPIFNPKGSSNNSSVMPPIHNSPVIPPAIDSIPKECVEIVAIRTDSNLVRGSAAKRIRSNCVIQLPPLESIDPTEEPVLLGVYLPGECDGDHLSSECDGGHLPSEYDIGHLPSEYHGGHLPSEYDYDSQSGDEDCSSFQYNPQEWNDVHRQIVDNQISPSNRVLGEYENCPRSVRNVLSGGHYYDPCPSSETVDCNTDSLDCHTQNLPEIFGCKRGRPGIDAEETAVVPLPCDPPTLASQPFVDNSVHSSNSIFVGKNRIPKSQITLKDNVGRRAPLRCTSGESRRCAPTKNKNMITDPYNDGGGERLLNVNGSRCSVVTPSRQITGYVIGFFFWLRLQKYIYLISSYYMCKQ